MVASGLSPRTAAHARVTLRRALSDAVRDGLVHRNVAALARPPRVTRRTIEPGRDYLDASQLRRLLAVAAEYRIGALVTVAATTGLRQGELLGLSWDDIDWTAGTLTVRRTMARAWGGGSSCRRPRQAAAGARSTWPRVTIEALRREQREQAAAREAAGTAWQDTDRLVFTDAVGRPLYADRGTSRLPRAATGRRTADESRSTGCGTRRPRRSYLRACRCASCRTCSGTPASRSPPTTTPTSSATCGAMPPKRWTGRSGERCEQAQGVAESCVRAVAGRRRRNRANERNAHARNGVCRGRNVAAVRPAIKARTYPWPRRHEKPSSCAVQGRIGRRKRSWRMLSGVTTRTLRNHAAWGLVIARAEEVRRNPK